MDFNRQAENWDDDKRTRRARVIAEEINTTAGLGEGGYKRAMEFGCGTGLISFNLQDKFKEIVLVDTSEGMIDKLNEKISNAGADHMKAVLLNVAKDNLDIGKFDFIYTSMSLHHIPDIDTTLQKLNKLLHTGGKLCIVDLDKEDGSFHSNEEQFDGHNGFDQHELAAVLEKLGLQVETAKTFYYDTKTANDQEVEYSLFIMTARKVEEEDR